MTSAGPLIGRGLLSTARLLRLAVVYRGADVTAGWEASKSSTSEELGMDSQPPRRVHFSAAVALAKRAAWLRLFPRPMANAKAP